MFLIYSGELEGEAGWMAFLAAKHHGDNAGQCSRLVERDKEHAKKNAKPRTLSIFNL